MDLGLFRRKKTVFWVWIVLPLLVNVAVHYSVKTYCQHTAKQIQKRSALDLYLPDVDSALTLSKAEIDKFSQVRGTASEVQSAVNTRISDVSAECGLMVKNLRITSESSSDPLKTLKVKMEGEGQLLAIMKFMNKLKKQELLISLVNTRIRIIRFSPEIVYSYLFEFDIKFVPTSENKS